MENVSGERFASGESLQWLSTNGERWWLSTENYSGELHIENYGNELYTPKAAVVGFKLATVMVVGFARRTKVASFRWRSTAMGYRRGTTVVGFKWRS